jgi:hypothetical protein
MSHQLEIGYPKWISQESAYEFPFLSAPVFKGTAVPNGAAVTLPDLAKEPLLQEILTGFLEKTKQFFVTPLQLEKIKKYLTHSIAETATFPEEDGFYQPFWRPSTLKMKSNEFAMVWSLTDWIPVEPLIQSDFFRPQTPKQSPEPNGQPNLRTIQIQNNLDALVPVSELPLSDLPPLNFGTETVEQKEVRRRIREARLKVELAKLKAKRMEQKYYERYGEAALDSEDSSLETSESDSDEPGGKYSYP